MPVDRKVHRCVVCGHLWMGANPAKEPRRCANKECKSTLWRTGRTDHRGGRPIHFRNGQRARADGIGATA